MAVADALVDAATEGIDFDGLRVEATDAGYTFETPAETREGLSADGLRDLAEDPHVTNWHHWERVVEGRGTHRRAFLRWLEGAERESERGPEADGADDATSAESVPDKPVPDESVPERYEALEDGVTRSWGELAITAELADASTGERAYEVRHEDDRGSAVEEHTDPLEARRLVKHDDRGRYRPLSTAPSLPHGWAFVDLDGRDLVRTVDFIYPATIANWHREREGDLDVTHYREAADRQTGIFQLVSQLDEEALEWAAEACCVDSQCLKRREWDEDEDAELDVPRGDGEFPCREPCSLFLSAARKFVTLEREEPREYTFELTPTEKEQLEELLDAVAEGRTDEIREGDLNEGANRYRARYLRAKRLTDRGLSDAPTYPEDE